MLSKRTVKFVITGDPINKRFFTAEKVEEDATYTYDYVVHSDIKTDADRDYRSWHRALEIKQEIEAKHFGNPTNDAYIWVISLQDYIQDGRFMENLFIKRRERIPSPTFITIMAKENYQPDEQLTIQAQQWIQRNVARFNIQEVIVHQPQKYISTIFTAVSAAITTRCCDDSVANINDLQTRLREEINNNKSTMWANLFSCQYKMGSSDIKQSNIDFLEKLKKLITGHYATPKTHELTQETISQLLKTHPLAGTGLRSTSRTMELLEPIMRQHHLLLIGSFSDFLANIHRPVATAGN